MDIAVLISFAYEESSSVSLPSSIVDTYRASNFCGKCDQHILSDWIISGRRRAPCKLGNNWNDFISGQDKNITQYRVLGQSSFGLVINSLSEKLSKAKRAIVYYSGHGTEDSCIEFPDGEVMTYIDYRNVIVNKFSPECEILMIVDCCSAGNFGFPFTLTGNRFRINEKNLRKSAVGRNVICITSTQPDQESIANKKYSFFTKYLFTSLLSIESFESRLDKLKSLVEERLLIRTFQHVGIHSSYNRMPIIWNWLHNKPNVEYKILGSFIVIKRDEKSSIK